MAALTDPRSHFRSSLIQASGVFQSNHDMNFIIFIIIISSIIALLARLHRFAERPLRKEEQAERDRLAREIAEEPESRFILDILSGGDISPFALYLRPFALERIFGEYQKELMLPHTLLVQMLLRQKVSFDFILQNHFSSFDMTLVSIGAPTGEEGAGHVVTTDASWQETFRKLAKRARSIVVVPGIQPGIMSEIRWLRFSGLLVKTVFFKPKEYPEAEWRKVQELYEQKECIDLPEYSPKQLSFRLYSSGRHYDLITWKTVYRKSKRELGEAQMRAILTNDRQWPLTAR